MEAKSSTSTFIFFLTLGRSLPDFFFQAANLYNSIGITLIPVNLLELNEIKKGEQEVSVIIYTSCLSELVKFYKLRKSNLDMAMNTKKFRIFHISSFGKVLDLDRAQRMGTYHHIALPRLTREICYFVASNVLKHNGLSQKWPGGRRAKLPFSSLN